MLAAKLNLKGLSGLKSGPTPPFGYALVTRADGTFIIRADGTYFIKALP